MKIEIELDDILVGETKFFAEVTGFTIDTVIANGLNLYLTAYGEDEVDGWISECEPAVNYINVRRHDRSECNCGTYDSEKTNLNYRRMEKIYNQIVG